MMDEKPVGEIDGLPTDHSVPLVLLVAVNQSETSITLLPSPSVPEFCIADASVRTSEEEEGKSGESEDRASNIITM